MKNLKVGDRVKNTLSDYHPLHNLEGTILEVLGSHDYFLFYGIQWDNGKYQPLIHVFIEIVEDELKIKRII